MFPGGRGKVPGMFTESEGSESLAVTESLGGLGGSEGLGAPCGQGGLGRFESQIHCNSKGPIIRISLECFVLPGRHGENVCRKCS